MSTTCPLLGALPRSLQKTIMTPPALAEATTLHSQAFRWHDTQLDHNFTIHSRTLFFFVIFLFFIILIVALLFLYSRFVCGSHNHRILQRPTTRAIHSQGTILVQGLDPDTINALPTKLYDYSATIEKSECCICLGVFEDGEKLKVLPLCQHCFHCDCVDKWLTTHSSCPLCRASILVDSAVLSIVTE